MSSDDTQIIQATEFNCEKDCKYLEPKVNKSGGKSVVRFVGLIIGGTLGLNRPFEAIACVVPGFVPGAPSMVPGVIVPDSIRTPVSVTPSIVVALVRAHCYQARISSVPKISRIPG